MNALQKFTLVLFTLPDGRIVLQRRTKDAPYAPGRLGIFGGWVEEGETPSECILREIKEETSLNATADQLEFVIDFTIPKGKDFAKDRHFYLYRMRLKDPHFAVYEGDGAEVYSLAELKQRSDLTGSALFTFNNIV